jgi:hypothetical protein
MEELQALVGGELDFDFFYLPWEVKRNINAGFAFINLPGKGDADRFCEMIRGRTWPSAPSAQPIEATAAHVQGLVPNLVNLRSLAGDEKTCAHQPTVIIAGRRVDFTAALALLAPEALSEPVSVSQPKEKTSKCAAHGRREGPAPSAVPKTALAGNQTEALPMGFRPPPGLPAPPAMAQVRKATISAPVGECEFRRLRDQLSVLAAQVPRPMSAC